MIALDDDLFERCGAGASPFAAQVRVLHQHEGVADALLVAARFTSESPAGDLWGHEEQPGLLRRHEALELARRLADEEGRLSLRSFVRYLDSNEEAQVLGRGWARRFDARNGASEYLAPGAREWVGLRRAAATCRAEVLREELAELPLRGAGADGPAVVRGRYDQRERERDDFAQPPAPDDAFTQGEV